jgi:hypothetical protein
MKIIGSKDSSTVIVEITKEEIARAIGKRSVYSMEQGIHSNEKEKLFATGVQYDLTQRVAYIDEIESLPKTVAEVRKTMDSLMKVVEKAEALVKSTTFVRIEEKKPIKS